MTLWQETSGDPNQDCCPCQKLTTDLTSEIISSLAKRQHSPSTPQPHLHQTRFLPPLVLGWKSRLDCRHSSACVACSQVDFFIDPRVSFRPGSQRPKAKVSSKASKLFRTPPSCADLPAMLIPVSTSLFKYVRLLPALLSSSSYSRHASSWPASWHHCLSCPPFYSIVTPCLQHFDPMSTACWPHFCIIVTPFLHNHLPAVALTSFVGS